MWHDFWTAVYQAIDDRGPRSGRRLAGLAEFPALRCRLRGSSPTAPAWGVVRQAVGLPRLCARR